MRFQEPPSLPLFVILWVLTVLMTLHYFDPRADTSERPAVLR